MSLAKKPTKKEIERTLEFVLAELVRYSKLSTDVPRLLSAIKQDDWVYEISFPDKTKRTIGKAAHQRLYELARQVIQSDERLKGKIKVGSYTQILSDNFGKMIFNRTDLNEKQFVEDCTTHAVSEILVSLETHIPCIAPSFRGLKKFVIGPITFYDKVCFLKERDADVLHYEGLPFHEFEDYHSLQNWIASVTISGFETELATERAYLWVRLALASIKCYIDSDESKWLGTERQSMPALRRYTLISHPDSEDPEAIHYGRSQQYITCGSDKDTEWLLSTNATQWFKLVGAFLDGNKDKGYWKFLDSKVITAIVWLDIGNSQISDAEKIVAFSNCLEALFVSSDQGIKKQIVDRSAGLLEHSGWRPEIHSKVGEFYSCRCKLVHGEASPIGADIREAAHIGKYLTDVCMEGFLHFAYWLLMKHQSKGTKEHDLPYSGKGSFDKAMSIELPLFVEVINRGRRQETTID